MTDNCPRDGKKLAFTGEVLECRHCGYTCAPPAGRQITREEVRDAIRQVHQRPPFSPKCRGRLHKRCAMPRCGCPCHDTYWDGHPPSELCGSLRVHGEHLWTGQTTGETLLCPGQQERA